jgi:hypothetical protein
MTQAYPLQWPEGWPRTVPHKREDGRSRFQHSYGHHTTIERTRRQLAEELVRLGAKNVVLSTNVELRLDGQPYSSRRPPEDPGIAVYFTMDGESMVMAQDAFDRVSDNTRSLTLAIAGMRQMQRHGGGTMLKRAFSGFTALPPPDQMSAIVTTPPRQWWDVLGVSPDAPMSVIRGAYRGLCRDAGGASTELNAAYEAAKDTK